MVAMGGNGKVWGVLKGEEGVCSYVGAIRGAAALEIPGATWKRHGRGHGWLRQGSSGGNALLAPYLLYEDWRDGEPLPGGAAKHMLPKVIDQLAGAEDVDCGEVVGAGGVVVVAVDGEDGQPHVEVGVHIVGKPVRARAGLNGLSAGGTEAGTMLSSLPVMTQQQARPVPSHTSPPAKPRPAVPCRLKGPTRPRSWRPGH